MSQAYHIVDTFEQAVAEYAGARYGVAVSSCTNAIFLCCMYSRVNWVHMPKYTYPGVAQSIKHAGGKLAFTNEAWSGVYKLRPYEIYDSALRFQRNMYILGSLYCLSFHIKKHLPIGRGGMILTDDIKAYAWLKRARYDGRGQVALSRDRIVGPGWNMYIQPEQAARGLLLFDMMKNDCPEDLPFNEQGYIDLSQQPYFKKGDHR